MEQQYKILAVDDNPINLAIIEELLEDEDCLLQMAESGEEVLEMAADFQPDMILLDIMMPGISGYEVCRQLRANSDFRNTKIILISAKAMASEQAEGFEAGADDYITKPFEGEEMLAKVREFAGFPA